MITQTTRFLDQIRENYMVGVLASRDDYLPRLGDDDEPVTYSEQMDEILFFIKPLSQEPKEMKQVQERTGMSDFYVGFGSKSLSLPIEYKHTTDINRKIKLIRDKLEGKLLLFKPVLTYQERNNRFHKNIDDIIVEEDWIEGVEYLAVPRVNMVPLEFEEKLIAEDPITFEQYNHAMPAPSYILCGDYIYGNIKENQWRIDSSKNHHDRVIISPFTVKRISVTQEEIQKNSGSERPNLVFLDEKFMFTTIADRFDIDGVFIGNWERQANTSTKEIKKEVGDPVPEEEKRPAAQKLDEQAFIRDLENIAKVKKLVYSSEDLINSIRALNPAL